MAVFFRIGSIAVAIFEVESEIFNRLSAKLLDDAGVNSGGGLPDSDRRGKRVRVSGVLLKRTQRALTKTPRRVRLEKVRAAIYGVDRLSPMGSELARAAAYTRLESAFQWMHRRSAGRSTARKGAPRSPVRRCTSTTSRRRACCTASPCAAPIARGRITGIHFDPAIDWDEFIVVTAADIPGSNRVKLITDDQPYLAVGASSITRKSRSC